MYTNYAYVNGRVARYGIWYGGPPWRAAAPNGAPRMGWRAH